MLHYFKKSANLSKHLILFSLLILIAVTSSCNSATRVVTMSSDGSYSIRYIDSKTPVNIEIPPVDIHK